MLFRKFPGSRGEGRFWKRKGMSSGSSETLSASEEGLAWAEKTFQRRECAHISANTDGSPRCGCGRLREGHPLAAESGDQWSALRSSRLAPTDALGTLHFMAAPAKVPYIRLAFDSCPSLTLRLMRRVWRLPAPKLVVSIIGGGVETEESGRLRRAVERGLVRLGKTMGVWLISGGRSGSLGRLVGTALAEGRSGGLRGVRIVDWGQVRRREDLVGLRHQLGHLPGLEPHQHCFLFADNGTTGRSGAAAALRQRLEEHIWRLAVEGAKAGERRGEKDRGGGWWRTPILLLVLGGGPETVRRVAECLTLAPPIPVLVVQGSGGAADLLLSLLGLKPHTSAAHLLGLARGVFESSEKLESLVPHMVSVVQQQEELRSVNLLEEAGAGLDHAILASLFEAQSALSPVSRLSLALAWNRPDVAAGLLGQGTSWPAGSLEAAMWEALAEERVDFVQLLAEQGLRLEAFLTRKRLTELYNTRHGPGQQWLRNFAAAGFHIASHVSLTDVWRMVEWLVGQSFASPETEEERALEEGFERPLDELLKWAVLTRRLRLAGWAWERCLGGLANALVAGRLCGRLAGLSSDVEVRAEYLHEEAAFRLRSLRLAERLWAQDRDAAQRLLTRELAAWGSQTCLSLAAAAGHQDLLSHPLCQSLLDDLWRGGLAASTSPNLSVLAALLCPPLLLRLEFKSPAQLARQPQTAEERLGLSSAEVSDDDDASHVADEEAVEQDLHTDTFVPHLDLEAGLPAVSVSSIPRPRAHHNSGQQKRHFSEALSSIQRSFDLPTKHQRRSVSPSRRVKTFRPRRVSSMSDLSVEPKHRKWALSLHTPSDLAPLDLDETTSEEGSTVAEGAKAELSWRRKVTEFYRAPVTTFWCFSLSYGLFLLVFSYALLVRSPPRLSWPEIFVAAYILSFALHSIIKIMTSEALSVWQRLRLWTERRWRLLRLAAIGLYVAGLALRLAGSRAARGVLSVDVVLWYVLVLELLMVNAELGLYVLMMGRMVRKAASLLLILLIVLTAFGLTWQALRFQDEDWSWVLVRDVFYKPYFMLYGEVYAGEIDECGDEGKNCVPGVWLAPLLMFVFLLAANVLLINLLIAVFNNVYNSLIARSVQLWRFNHYYQVMEYEAFSPVPPPLIVLADAWSLVAGLRRRLRGRRSSGRRAPGLESALSLAPTASESAALDELEAECLADMQRQPAPAEQLGRTEELERRLATLEAALLAPAIPSSANIHASP